MLHDIGEIEMEKLASGYAGSKEMKEYEHIGREFRNYFNRQDYIGQLEIVHEQNKFLNTLNDDLAMFVSHDGTEVTVKEMSINCNVREMRLSRLCGVRP